MSIKMITILFYNITSKYILLTAISISHATQLAGTTKGDEKTFS